MQHKETKGEERGDTRTSNSSKNSIQTNKESQFYFCRSRIGGEIHFRHTWTTADAVGSHMTAYVVKKQMNDNV